MKIADKLREKLTRTFKPTHLVIENHSATHKDHHHGLTGGESHFFVSMASKAFRGESALERQRMVYKTLAQDIKDGLHALELKLYSDEEVAEK